MKTTETTRFTSALSESVDWQQAVDEVCSQVRGPDDPPPDLVVMFFSSDHSEVAEQLAAEVHRRLQCDALLGTSAESVLGRGQEVEQQPALSLWAGWLPGASLLPMKLDFERTPEGGVILGWPDDLPEDWQDPAALLVLADPFSFPMELLLERFNADQPGMPICGGMASGCSVPGESRLVLAGDCMSEGAVAVRLGGELKIRTLVSQGCRPIGEHMVITQSEHNVVQQLRGESAMLRLKEVFDRLPANDQERVQQGLFLGRVVSEYQDDFGQGDFLIRNVIGMDPEQGTITVADYMRAGQTVQFHIRDQETASAELVQLLSSLQADDSFQPAGGLLFTCNGRGSRLFDTPHHDATMVQQHLADIPLAGFFAQGEIGPIGGENFLHGFTASVILFGG
jgi:small ligand-binding sensory domain FIST